MMDLMMSMFLKALKDFFWGFSDIAAHPIFSDSKYVITLYYTTPKIKPEIFPMLQLYCVFLHNA